MNLTKDENKKAVEFNEFLEGLKGCQLVSLSAEESDDDIVIKAIFEKEGVTYGTKED